MDSVTKHEIPHAGAALPVAESFYSVQGEGANTGKAAWFIRLGGCDVHCPWCDSKGTWHPHAHRVMPVSEIIAPIVQSPAINIVITGGEPLMHDLSYLCEALKDKGYNLFLETSGTHPLSGRFDWICVSPKMHRPPLQEVLADADELKFIVSGPESIKWAEEISTNAGKSCILLLQPEWDVRDKALPLIIEYAKAHPQWRVSLQTHKYMNIP